MGYVYECLPDGIGNNANSAEVKIEFETEPDNKPLTGVQTRPN